MEVMLVAEDKETAHGTKVCVDLVKPWSHSQRLVRGDSYFASVHTAEMLMLIGLWFIGVLKTAREDSP
jgi:hypothetical protein